MKRINLTLVVLLTSALCAAQMAPSHAQANDADPHTGAAANPHGAVPSSRSIFGKECGIADSASQSAIWLSRSPEGKWSQVTKDKRPGDKDNAVARVWRESNWMVDLHDAPGSGTTIHTGQMCFDAKGRITRLIDRFMDTPECDCMRYTSLTFDATSGRVTRREQKYVQVDTGAEIAEPAAAKGFPEVFGFHKVDQLPFYALVKQ